MNPSDIPNATRRDRRPTSRRPLPSTVLTVALLIGASACAVDNDDTNAAVVDTAEPADGTDEPEPDASEPDTVEPDATVEATDPVRNSTPDDDVMPAPTECVEGNWIVTEPVLTAYFDAVTAHSGFGPVTTSGEMRVSFTDESYTWINDYALELTVGDNEYQVEQHGSFGGAYEAANDILTGTVDHDERTASLTDHDGPIADAGDLFTSITPARPLDNARFTCDANTLTIGAGTMADPHDITLTRL